MAAIKMCTDIPQSKVLAEILPLESADLCYRYYSGGMITGYGDCVLAKSFITGKNVIQENDLPCWSLTALLSVVSEDVSLNSFKNGVWIAMVQHNGKMIYRDTHNPVDACYKLILKLHELKKL